MLDILFLTTLLISMNGTLLLLLPYFIIRILLLLHDPHLFIRIILRV